MSRLQVLAVLAAVGCITDDPGIITNPGETGIQGDFTPPVITHVPPEGSQVYGETVRLTAEVVDEDSAIFVVQIYYRQETSSMWEDAAMVDSDGDGTYTGQIPGEDVITGGMYYYLYALDASENEAFEPPEGENAAHHFRIAPAEG
jgi:hypothetical protein